MDKNMLAPLTEDEKRTCSRSGNRRRNEGHAYTFDRATLIKMLDDALVNSRPRIE
jgi:hypothetical protein